MNESIRSGVTEVVQRIVAEHGGIRAAELVAAARPKDSPAHGGFEWDNKKGADQYRLIQARQWLRAVRVVYRETEERLVHVPSRGNEENEGTYKVTSVVIATPDEFERALAEATATLHAARRAIEELRSAVDRRPSPDRAAMVAQIAHGLEIMQNALEMVH